MLKLSGQKIPTKILLLFLSDILIITFGVLVAICLRFLDGPAIRGYLDEPYIFFRIGLVVLTCELALYYNDLYKPEAVRRRIELLVRLLQSMGLSYLGLALLYYAIPNHVLGRGIAALAASTIFLLLIAWRLAGNSSFIMIAECSLWARALPAFQWFAKSSLDQSSR